MKIRHYLYHNLLLLFLLMCGTTFATAQHNGPGGHKRKGRVNGKTIDITPRPQLDPSDCEGYHFRRLNGTCNNISDSSRMEYGATDIPLYRALPAIYGASDPNNALSGMNRSSPRAISNLVADQEELIYSGRNLSAMVFNWGQFLDHDISLTPESHTDPAPIPLPTDEVLFTVDIPFMRSEVYDGTGISTPRQQLNLITAWIDASMVYGTDSARSNWLRTHTDGKLKVSSGNLLPFNTVDGEYTSPVDTTAPSMAGADANGRMWVAGDVRAGEQTGLTCLHTLFVREHNRICDELVEIGLNDDEYMYQLAKKQVAALIQHITYSEFLPALGLELPAYNGYDPTIRPDIYNLFATAAYRLGHTMVIDSVHMLNDLCQPVADTVVSLIQAFFNPEIIRNHGISSYLKGLTTEVQGEVDPYIVDELRNFLFSDPTQSPIVAGLDLVSANIQRGRDHGLPDYNTLRSFYLGSPVNSFAEISSDDSIRTKLASAYLQDINDIDAWVGLLSEDHVPGTSMGPTLYAMLLDQFTKLRDGDRFYFAYDLSRSDRERIQKTSLADVIIRNTSLSILSNTVMYANDCSSLSHSQISNQIKIYPNPSRGIIRLHTRKRNLRIRTYSLIDVNGVQLIGTTQVQSRIDLIDINPGTYFLVLNTNKGMAMKTLVLTP